MAAADKKKSPGGEATDDVMDGAFDESILSEIESRLGADGEALDGVVASGDKVELDRADLPLDALMASAREEEPAEVEVDLSDHPPPDAHDEPAEKAAPETGSKKRLILAAAAALLLVALAGGGYWWFTRPEEQAPVVSDALPPWVASGQVPKVSDVLQLALEPFIVPLLNSDQGRILRVEISIEAMDRASRDELLVRVIELRDVVYRSLRNRPATELKQAKDSRMLQAQLKAELNHALKADLVNRVFFTKFLISG